MKIQQFEDKGLAIYSYILLSEGDKKAVVIDPTRDTAPYLAWLEMHGATLVGIIETHPHADFISGHAELARKTRAKIYVNTGLGALYDFIPFDEGATIALADFTLRCLHTPGHSPDSISILLEVDGHPKAVFTGDTLFIGDVGRPDLRENAGNITAGREHLARELYRSTRSTLMTLPGDTMVYPAHGAGSLCGKALSTANSSTIGAEILTNPALQAMDEDAFVDMLLEDLPYAPRYFGNSVEINRCGAADLDEALARIPRLSQLENLPKNILIIDSRPEAAFKRGHLPGSINLMDGGKFDTWLGSVVSPGEPFILIAESNKVLEKLIYRCAFIGYETQILGAYWGAVHGIVQSPYTDHNAFLDDPDRFTIIDIRNPGEVKGNPLFQNALHIPLPELRERMQDIPDGKPVMVHCAGGYRSPAGQSIIEAGRPELQVYDLGEAVKTVRPSATMV